MKNNKYLFEFAIAICLVLLFPKIAFANWADCHMQIEGSSQVNMGDNFILSLGSEGVTSGVDITGLHYVIEYYNDQVEPISVSNGGISSIYGWENISTKIQDTNSRVSYLIIDANTNIPDRYAYYSNLGMGYNKLLNVQFKVKKDAIGGGTFVRLMPTELTAGHYYPTSNLMSYKNTIYNGENDVEPCVDSPKSSINFYKKAYLNSILIDNNEINNFDKNSDKYSISSSSKEITISAKSDNGYSISGDVGKKTLKDGSNTFVIKVTSPTNDIKNYTINVSYNVQKEKSKINTLKTLKLSAGEINFSSNLNNYNVEVEYDIDKIKIDSTLTDSKSSYIDGYGNREVELKDGTNEVLLKVKAENDDINTYTLIINRKEKADEVSIKNLKISNYELDFMPEKTNYFLEIDDETDKLDFTVELANKQDDYDISGNSELKDGSKVVITVSNKEGDKEKKYVTNIKKNNKVLNTNDSSKKNSTFKIVIIALICSIVTGVAVASIFIIKNKNS